MVSREKTVSDTQEKLLNTSCGKSVKNSGEISYEIRTGIPVEFPEVISKEIKKEKKTEGYMKERKGEIPDGTQGKISKTNSQN